MKRKPKTIGPPDYLGVGTTITATDGNEIIVIAKDLNVLKSYLSDETGYPESRQVALYLGPRVEIQPITPELIKPSGFEDATKFAALLNGREMGHEINPRECEDAEELGLVVVFGYSDDCTEFRGAIHDEAGCGGLTISGGKILDDDQLEALESLLADGTIKTPPVMGKIKACWCDEITGIPWTYQTEIPHATFDILEDGEVFCRGIVFSITDIK